MRQKRLPHIYYRGRESKKIQSETKVKTGFKNEISQDIVCFAAVRQQVKKILKKSKKSVDNGGWLWYYNQAL